VITVVVVRWDGLLFDEGIDGRPASFIALGVASTVAIVVWLLLRKRFVYENTTDAALRPNRPPRRSPNRRRR
jgi:hypothetical protein